MEQIRIAVLVSGGGTNLQALIDAEKSGIVKSGTICLVVSDKADAYALTRAQNAGIETAVLSKKQLCGQEAFEEKLIALLNEKKIDMIVLAGFMCILTERFTSRYPERIINIHPSLIPSFCGKGFYGLRVHEAALSYGVKVTGATVHYVNEVPDGGKIIMQKAVEIEEGDTPEVLQKRVMQQAEWIILPLSCERVAKKILEERGKTMNVYETEKIGERISSNPYVGRGIVIGKSADGKKAVSAYFIMGRSENSRNRVFLEKDGMIITAPFDESKVEDPSLIIYHAIRTLENHLIVTNGDQTDTVYDGMAQGKSFSDSLKSRCFEPDGPNFTPRISGVLTFENGDFSYQMSILKSADEKGSACNRFTFDYAPICGVGHFIHTYVTDGNPLPTFVGEPERVVIPDNIDEFTNDIWTNLNESNRISLYVRYTDLATGEIETRLINRNK